MPLQVQQILQNLTGCMYQSLLFFGFCYLAWFGVKYFLVKSLTAKHSFNVLFLIISIGTIQFFYNVIQSFIQPVAIHSFTLNYLPNSFLLHYTTIIVGIIYVFFFIFKIIKFIVEQLQFKKEENVQVPFNTNDLEQYLILLCDYLKIKTPSLFTSTSAIIPFTKGILKKIIVLPIAYVNHFNEQEMEAVILHEIAHIKRKDHLTNIVVILCDMLLYFNPFAQLLLKQIRFERELACDDWVLQQNITPKNYALALQKVATSEINFKKQLAMYVPQNELLFRIKRLFQQHDNLPVKLKIVPFIFLLVWSLFLIKTPAIHKINALEAMVKVNYCPVTKTNSLAFVSQKKPIENVMQCEPSVANVAIVTNATKPVEQVIVDQVDLIEVANVGNDVALKTIVNNNIAKVNNAILKLNDSTVFYDNNLSLQNIESATFLPMQKILQIIASTDEANTFNLVSDPVQIKVSQQGVANAFYNNVTLQQVVRYDENEKTWSIVFDIKNDKNKLALKVLRIKLDKKLQSISL